MTPSTRPGSTDRVTSSRARVAFLPEPNTLETPRSSTRVPVRGSAGAESVAGAPGLLGIGVLAGLLLGALENLLELVRRAVDRHRRAAGIAVDGVEDLLLVPQLRQAAQIPVVLVLLRRDEDVDVRLRGGVGRIVLE